MSVGIGQVPASESVFRIFCGGITFAVRRCLQNDGTSSVFHPDATSGPAVGIGTTAVGIGTLTIERLRSKIFLHIVALRIRKQPILDPLLQTQSVLRDATTTIGQCQ